MNERPTVSCPGCGRPTAARNVFVTMWLGAELNVIDDVPAHVCDPCSIQLYDPDIEEQIRELVSAGFPPHRASHQISVPVFRLNSAPVPESAVEAARLFEARQETAQS